MSIAAVVAAAAALLFPLLVLDRALLNDDFIAHFGWAEQWRQALAQGVFYPRWMPRDWLGLGDPAFLYYPPLAHFALGALGLLTGEAWSAIQLFAPAALVAIGVLGLAWTRKLGLPPWRLR